VRRICSPCFARTKALAGMLAGKRTKEVGDRGLISKGAMFFKLPP
jgi:hypothetical protein